VAEWPTPRYPVTLLDELAALDPAQLREVAGVAACARDLPRSGVAVARGARPMLCASVCMVVASRGLVAPRGLAVKLQHSAVCGSCADLATPRRD
jgi:hypothetical protein